MSVDGYSDDDFHDVVPKRFAPTVLADITMKFIKAPRTNELRLHFNIAEAVLAEIHAADAGTKIAFGWSQEKKAFRFKAGSLGLYSPIIPAKGQGRRWLRTPSPGGVFFREGVFDPEFYVDHAGRQIIIECPDELTRPSVKLIDGPRIIAEPSRQAPRHPGAPVDDPVVQRAYLGADLVVPSIVAGIHFAPSEMQILRVFTQRNLVTKAAVLAATADPGDPDESRDEKIVDVWICKIRAKLEPIGLHIETVWGQGYKMPQKDKVRLQLELKRASDEANK